MGLIRRVVGGVRPNLGRIRPKLAGFDQIRTEVDPSWQNSAEYLVGLVEQVVRQNWPICVAKPGKVGRFSTKLGFMPVLPKRILKLPRTPTLFSAGQLGPASRHKSAYFAPCVHNTNQIFGRTCQLGSISAQFLGHILQVGGRTPGKLSSSDSPAAARGVPRAAAGRAAQLQHRRGPPCVGAALGLRGAHPGAHRRLAGGHGGAAARGRRRRGAVRLRLTPRLGRDVWASVARGTLEGILQSPLDDRPEPRRSSKSPVISASVPQTSQNFEVRDLAELAERSPRQNCESISGRLGKGQSGRLAFRPGLRNSLRVSRGSRF